MESNHRFLDVNQASLPLDHRTMSSERKPWDSNPQADLAATCFQDRLLIQPDGFRR